MNQNKIAQIHFDDNLKFHQENLVIQQKEKINKTPVSTDIKNEIPSIDIMNFTKINQNMSKYFKELSDKRSTNMSDAHGQKSNFISNAEVSAKYYTNSTSMGSHILQEQKSEQLSMGHSKSHMSPTKVKGIQIDKSVLKRTQGRNCYI